MQINIFQVDAFTEKSFGGNPAGVVPDARRLTEDEMQKIAKEMNVSETAFVIPVYDDLFEVRFFTPICEVDLCGHGTIAAFFTMAKKRYINGPRNGKKTIYQKTKVGKLAVDLIYRNGEIYKVFMEQAVPKDLGDVSNLDELIRALGINMEDIGIENKLIDPRIISTGLPDIIIPIKKKETLDNLKIDMELITKISKENNAIGVHVFYLPDNDSEVVYTRSFAPLLGIDEESATGTANGSLIYYLKNNSLLKSNKILAYQGESINRPSKIYCNIDSDNKVMVGGKAKVMIDGIMCI